ncbi:cytochrome C oxidase subunit IV family protein [Haloechinothrix salitolerans]|uniref:Cytochrome C oxidase subunit IV family protein n=1 Tax=Haloechinothrix salitolerans TaxID=926830 RepID=A0ABW2BTQ0_9PSEU
MTTSSTRPRNVYFGLLLVSVATLVLVTEEVQDVLSAKVAAAIAVTIAFGKARFVVLDFMELRHAARVRTFFDTWLVVMCLGCVALILR